MKPWLIALGTLNTADLALTELWLRLGIAYEANPLLGPLTQSDSLGWAAVVKVALVLGGMWILWHNRRFASAVIATKGLTLAYVLLMFIHLGVVMRLCYSV